MTMIEINLLPEEAKVRKEKFTLEPKYSLYLAAVVFSLLLFLHFYLGIIKVIKDYQYRALVNKWKVLEPQKVSLDQAKKVQEAFSQDSRFLQQAISKRTSWSEKLNRLSLDLPAGIWFNEIFLTSKDLVIKASAVSLEKEEMGLVSRFIDNLKKDNNFFVDFTNLELGPVQAKTIGGYDVMEFVLTAALKSK